MKYQCFSPDCVDKAMNCKAQLQHKNYCKHEDAWIKKFFLEQCQKSCGSCGSYFSPAYFIHFSQLIIIIIWIAIYPLQIAEDSSTGTCKSCNCWTCLNGGTCSVKRKNPTCKCPSGYSGSHCHFTGKYTLRCCQEIYSDRNLRSYHHN